MSCRHLLPAFRAKFRCNPVSTADYIERLMEQGFQTIMVSKPRISFEDRGKVLALSEEGYSQSQEGLPGVCMIPQGLDS